jgi:uncharacterized protein YegL
MTTMITLLLDRSGSMRSILQDTLGGYNAYKDGLREIDGTFSLVMFDTQSIDKVHTHLHCANIPDLTEEVFVPRGGTPLIDATMKTIQAVERSVKDQPDAKVVIAILTDGQENDSRQYGWEQLHNEIDAKKELGWQFLFLGAGLGRAAYAQASRMGIGAAQTMSYDADDRAATMDAWEASAINTVSFASGAARSVAYSAEQKAAAKDTFADKPVPAAAPVSAGVPDFDL